MRCHQLDDSLEASWQHGTATRHAGEQFLYSTSKVHLQRESMQSILALNSPASSSFLAGWLSNLRYITFVAVETVDSQVPISRLLVYMVRHGVHGDFKLVQCESKSMCNSISGRSFL